MSNRLLKPLQKLLLDAADYLEKYGHHKGAYFEHYSHDDEVVPFPPACMMGAMYAAVDGRPYADTSEHPLVYAGESYLSKYLDVDDITAWNDKPERTANDVITAFRTAAVLYKEED